MWTIFEWIPRDNPGSTMAGICVLIIGFFYIWFVIRSLIGGKAATITMMVLFPFLMIGPAAFQLFDLTDPAIFFSWASIFMFCGAIFTGGNIVKIFTNFLKK